MSEQVSSLLVLLVDVDLEWLPCLASQSSLVTSAMPRH
jgi:hypothetical protein